MIINRMKIIFSILLLSITATGCIGVDRSFRGMRNYVLEFSENEYKKEIEFSVGFVTIGMAGLVVSASDIEEPIDELLSEISNVQIGVYNNNSDNRIKPNFKEAKFLTKKMERAGWNCIVRSVNRDEMVLLFVKTNNDEINQLFVITVNDDEVVLAEVLGNLHKIIEIAIRERGFDLASANKK